MFHISFQGMYIWKTRYNGRLCVPPTITPTARMWGQPLPCLLAARTANSYAARPSCPSATWVSWAPSGRVCLSVQQFSPMFAAHAAHTQPSRRHLDTEYCIFLTDCSDAICYGDAAVSSRCLEASEKLLWWWTQVSCDTVPIQQSCSQQEFNSLFEPREELTGSPTEAHVMLCK